MKGYRGALQTENSFFRVFLRFLKHTRYNHIGHVLALCLSDGVRRDLSLLGLGAAAADGQSGGVCRCVEER